MINGVELIPSSLVACFVNQREARIVELGFEGFSFRIAEKLEKIESIILHYFQFQQSSYQTVIIKEFTIAMEESEYYVKYSIKTEQNDYKMYTNTIIKDYGNYISLKLAGDYAYLSEQMTDYPADAEEEYYDSFSEQKKEWFEQLQGISYQMNGAYELALSIDNPKRYRQYLVTNISQYQKEYLRENNLETHPLLQKPVNRIYLGNQFCHNLIPARNEYISMLKKAKEEEVAVTLVFTYLREEMTEVMQRLFEELYDWCRSEQMGIEIVVNDWGMVKMLEEKRDFFHLNLGILLNKRRKDPRYRYKCGFAENVDKLAENNLNSGNYRKYLMEKWNISRYEYESCGYQMKIPDTHSSLHLPYYQTNTSQYCTLYAKYATGNRGNQNLVMNCPHYCEELAFMYPKHLKMIGKYNSLFAYDDIVLKDATGINQYLQQGIDRIVLNLL